VNFFILFFQSFLTDASLLLIMHSRKVCFEKQLGNVLLTVYNYYNGNGTIMFCTRFAVL